MIHKIFVIVLYRAGKDFGVGKLQRRREPKVLPVSAGNSPYHRPQAARQNHRPLLPRIAAFLPHKGELP